MTYNWARCTVKEASILLTDGAHASPPSVEKGVPMASVKDMTNFGINLETCRHISDVDAERLEKQNCIPINGDILIAKDGSILKHICVFNQKDKIVLLSSIALLRVNEKFNPYFVKYYLEDPGIRFIFLGGYTSGSAIPRFVIRDFASFPLICPPITTQNQIVSVLKTIDDMIRSLKNESTTLEELTSVLFKSWFIDFDPVKAKAEGRQPFGMDEETAALFPYSFEDFPLGPIPAGWKVGKMKDTTKVIGGGTPSTKNPDYWGGDICWTSPKDLSNLQGLILLDTAKKITEKGLSKVSSGLLPSNTVLISSRAPIGYLALTRIPMAINQGYIAFGQNKIFGPSYLLNWCKFNLSVIEAYAGGSTFPEISKSNFKEIRCLIPPVEILEKFETLCKPLFDQLEVNARTINSLEDTRGSLLPRLMSGELKIEDLEV